MIADCRLQIEVYEFFTGRFWAFKSEICILKSKITGLHHSSRLPQEGKTIEPPLGGGPKPDTLSPNLLFRVDRGGKDVLSLFLFLQGKRI